MCSVHILVWKPAKQSICKPTEHFAHFLYTFMLHTAHLTLVGFLSMKCPTMGNVTLVLSGYWTDGGRSVVAVAA